MAELTTLARPYAKAAFEHALKASDLKGWAQSLRTAAAVSQAANVGDLLHSPALTTEQKTQTFVELCADELNGAQQNFISVMAENHRLPLLPQVLELFELYKANHEKAIDVEILTAYEINKAVQDKLAKVLSEKLDREVALRAAVDTSLLGGAVIRAGDTVIDGSAKGKLAKLAEAMSH